MFQGIFFAMAATDVTLAGHELRDEARPAAPRKADWPLMGDIVSHRAGVPEHLIRWRRAEGDTDPEPML